MRRGPKDQPGEVQWLLLGLGLQLRANHAGGRAALTDAYDLAENRRGAEIRARLFGRHGRGAGAGKQAGAGQRTFPMFIQGPRVVAH